MFRPINPDRSFSGVSLAESFAECYAKKYGVEVGLICCADGGTTLDQWAEGEILFDNAVAQAKLAQRTSEIVGILWHQGEGDCAPDKYVTYESRFNKFMTAMREALGLQDVPFLIGGLGDFLAECTLSDKLVNYHHVNDALRSSAENNPMTGFVSAEGLGSNPDLLHFSSEALYEFGKRYFEEFEKFGVDISKLNKVENTDAIRSEMEKL